MNGSLSYNVPALCVTEAVAGSPAYDEQLLQLVGATTSPGPRWTLIGGLGGTLSVPVVVLIPRRCKRPSIIKALMPLVLAGLWLERWLLIAPDGSSPSLVTGVVIALLFAAVFVGVVRAGGELVKP